MWEILVISVTFWVVLLGIYGSWPYVRGFLGRRDSGRLRSDIGLTSSDNDPPAVATTAPAESPLLSHVQPFQLPDRPLLGGSVAEVDRLRAQVEQSRSESVDLSSASSAARPPPSTRT